MKLNLNSKKIEKVLKSLPYLPEQETWVKCYGLEKLGLSDGQYLGQAESNTRTYDLYAYKNDSSVVIALHQSEWIVKLVGLENEADRQEKLTTGKWLLSKGVITKEEAWDEYGYKE